MKPYLKPIFFDDFSCIAGACRNTCCGCWNIKVDPVTAEKYKKHNIGLDDKSNLLLDDNGMCLHLREDGLCGLVCRYDESMLSYTCDFFPRTALENENYVELYLDNACQAVLEFLMNDDEQNRHLIFTDCETYERKISYKKFFNEKLFAIRDFVIDLLQVEAASVWTRFFAAYRFICSYSDKDMDQVSDGIGKYYDENYLAKTLFDIDNLGLDIFNALQYKALMFANVNATLKNGIIYKKYIIPITEYLKDADLDAMSGAWNEFKEITQRYEYFFENFAVNGVYRSLLPTDEREKLSDNAEVLLFELSMSYFTCFMWWFLNESKITSEEIIDISGHYARIIEHNKVKCSGFMNKLKDSGDLSLAVFYMLLQL